jgi:hypothetical protein
MGDRFGQQGSQVFYDPSMGQYYTQEFQTPSYGMYNNPMMGGANYMQQPSMLGRGGERIYINGIGQTSPAMKETAPYEYADVSLETLFPMIQSAMQGSQGGALSGLLGSQGATSQASSGAGRFM